MGLFSLSPVLIGGKTHKHTLKVPTGSLSIGSTRHREAMNGSFPLSTVSSPSQEALPKNHLDGIWWGGGRITCTLKENFLKFKIKEKSFQCPRSLGKVKNGTGEEVSLLSLRWWLCG